MTLRDLALLLLLGAVFGAAFLFIRLTAPVFGPAVLVFLRVLLAAGALLLYARLRGQRLGFQAAPWEWLAVGGLNLAAPFTLTAFAELHITASLAAILVATIPMFTALVATFWLGEPLGRKKVLGLALGALGIVVLSGWSPLPFTRTTLASILGMLVGSACVGVGSVYVKKRFEGASALTLAVGNLLASSALLLPFALATLPRTPPSPAALLALLTLVLLCTAFGFVLSFHLIQRLGPTSAASVAFLVPVFGTLWGVLFLAEPLNLAMLLGFGVVLVSVGLVTGLELPLKRPA